MARETWRIWRQHDRAVAGEVEWFDRVPRRRRLQRLPGPRQAADGGGAMLSAPMLHHGCVPAGAEAQQVCPLRRVRALGRLGAPAVAPAGHAVVGGAAAAAPASVRDAAFHAGIALGRPGLDERRGRAAMLVGFLVPDIAHRRLRVPGGYKQRRCLRGLLRPCSRACVIRDQFLSLQDRQRRGQGKPGEQETTFGIPHWS
mmetsp:Transcript_108372/g.305603  ORF Transcript_108372/g.305603 Transcript_108372/m.305603 type:complete len:200 (+) Transcript_108372:896-1495(+)